jgi:hypothetical protein
MVWFETTLGPESDSVSLNEVTLAASAKRSEGKPSDQRIMARLTIAAVAWSTEKEFVALFIALYVVLGSQFVDMW